MTRDGAAGSDRERWDAKHTSGTHDSIEPDPFVVRALDLLANLSRGTALDLAAGTGRHALELARRGWSTTAWDVSPVGLGKLSERADEGQLAVETRALDLLGERIPVVHFDLVLVANFLDRALWDRLHELVPVGGHLIATTFTVDRPGEKPPLDYCLDRGELARGLPGFATLLTEEADGRAGLIAARQQLASG